ncbi:class I SAM-dependent methyltransferase [Phytomonospora endophytica]|uniref:SAM-dependent methyltransferase n=1 Tax=Phytomonospora endophytica TaxID=714109 RepID=A0A841FXD5_9ACTN|nr:methyltransferase [Phytomonospora endophytica]MBB6036630.1 SAM-dependent methyltransferase [Phytomonospora endophytica]GIG65951.1 methyltransferase [Phytomonospora endophytica]
MSLDVLRSPEGAALLGVAAGLAAADPSRAAVALRAHTDDPALASAVLTQATLRLAAAAKFGADAEHMFFTRDGLEQATRPPVAGRRAERLRAAGATRVADLCCGIGTEAVAMARAGLRVVAVDADAETAALAAANVEGLGLGGLVEVRHDDALTTSLDGCDAVFADPARRDARGRRVFDPAAYTPPLDALVARASGVPLAAVKVGPGIPHAAIPAGAEAEWVSVDGDVVEAALWLGEAATVPRRATVVRGGEVHELTGDGERPAPVGEPGRYLYEPDGAVLRTYLVSELADRLHARLGDATIGYLYTDAAVDTPFARGFAVAERMPFVVKRLRAALRERGVGRLTVKKRGVDVDPDALRRELLKGKAAGSAEATVVVTRVEGQRTAFICEELPRA